MIGIFRASIAGSSVAGLASAVVVQSLFFTAVSVLMVIAAAILRPPTVSKGSPRMRPAGLCVAVVIPIIVVAAIVVLFFLWPRLKPRVLDQWRKSKQGAAIFRDWRRYGGEVAVPSAPSYCCRGVNVIFMVAFGIPVAVFTVISGRVLAHALRALRDHAGRSGADPGARRRNTSQVCLGRRRRRLIDHARLDHDHLERCPRSRRHALGVRLHPDESVTLEQPLRTSRAEAQRLELDGAIVELARAADDEVSCPSAGYSECERGTKLAAARPPSGGS